jgi:DNA-binding LytR/AlgR family response regulator
MMPGAPKRVVIVDDEHAARAQLREVIDAMPELAVIAEISNGADAIQAINEHAPDIVFLDIDMPQVDGFSVAQATEHLMYQLVFVTAHHQYALRAFETQAIDYLLKPARPSLIEKCLEKILRQEVLSLDTQSSDSIAETIVLEDGGTRRVIKTKHVIYIEGLGRYRRIHLSAEGAFIHQLPTLLSNTTLDEFTAKLNSYGFLRVHRSYLINLSLVTTLKSSGRQYNVFLHGTDREIPVARPRVKATKVALS